MSRSLDHPGGAAKRGTGLAERRCSACTADTPRVERQAAEEMLRELSGWTLDDAGHLARSWKVRNFKEALEMVSRIGAVAERENHHPEIRFGWGHVELELWTHATDGLSENDFILAAKIDAALST